MNALYAFMASFFSHFLKLIPASIRTKVGDDKVMHFFAGMLISLGVLASHALFKTDAMLMVYVPIVVGLLKEVLDFTLNQLAKRAGQPAIHGVELLDAVATASGCLPVFALAKLVVLFA